MAFILGVTGGIGSGKSAATQWFESQGIQVVDADIVAREVVEKANLPSKNPTNFWRLGASTRRQSRSSCTT